MAVALSDNRVWMDSRGFDSLFYEGATGGLLAGRDGQVYALEDGPNDAGASIHLLYLSRYFDQGAPNNEKTYQDLVIEHNTQGTELTVELVLDNGARSIHLGTIFSTLPFGERQQSVFRIEDTEGARGKNCAVLIEGDTLGTTDAPVTIFSIFLHYYIEARGAKHYDSDEQDFGTQKVKRIRAVELDIENANEVVCEVHSDMPGNAMAARVSKTVLGGASRRKVQVPIPEAVEGRHLRLLVYSPNEQEFRLYQARGWVQAYGTYIEAYEAGAGQVYDSFDIPIVPGHVAAGKALELDVDTDGAVTALIQTDLPGNTVITRKSTPVNTESTTSGRRIVRIPLEPYPEGHLWRVRLEGAEAMRLFGARLEAKPYGVYVEAYEASGGRTWDSDTLDLGDPRVKEIREAQFDIDTDGPVTMRVFSELPGLGMAVRATQIFNTELTTPGRRMMNVPFPAIEGRLVRVELAGSSALRLYGAWLFARPIGYYVESYQAQAGHIWDSTVLDFGTQAVKRILQLEIEAHGDSPMTVRTHTSNAAGEVELRDITVIAAGAGRKPYIVPLKAVYGRLARVTIQSGAAFRLFRVRAYVKPIGVYLNGGSNEVFPVEPEQDLGSERVKLYKEIEAVYSADAPGSLKFFAELPGLAVAAVEEFALPASDGTRPVKLRLPGHAKGRLVGVEVRPGAGDLRLYGLRLWARTAGEAGPGAWSWLALPIPETPDNYGWTDLYVAPTPPAWDWAEIPVAKTPVAWSWAELPVERTPELPSWAEFPVNL